MLVAWSYCSVAHWDTSRLAVCLEKGRIQEHRIVMTKALSGVQHERFMSDDCMIGT